MDSNLAHNIRIFYNLDEMSSAAAHFLTEQLQKTVKEKGYCTLMLSGGSTPKRLYSLLAEPHTAKKIAWKKVKIFWGDERFIPHNHPESNYRMAFDTLLSRVPIPEENIYPIPTDTISPDKAAIAYEVALKDFFNQVEGYTPKYPSFDFILLGVGKDGHIASLYPNNSVLQERERWFREVMAPPLYTIRERITLTLPVINHGRNTIFLVSGNDKKSVIKQLLLPDKNLLIPANLVYPTGTGYLFTDVKITV